MIYLLQFLNIAATAAIAFFFKKKLNEQNQKFNRGLEKFKFQNSNIQLNALKHIELITTSRIQWIQELRENISILLANLDTLIIEISYRCKTSGDFSRFLTNLDIFYLMNKISLQLNKKDCETDKKLIDSLEQLELKVKVLLAADRQVDFYIQKKTSIEEIMKMKTEIKEKSRGILKKEWERVKEEIPKTINK